MTKMKFVFAALAVLIGVGGAYASRIQQIDLTQHNWVDGNNTLIMIGTMADAEANCPGNDVFCLRASDAPSLVAYRGN
jgi:hypothetical protein